jgi:hypothetical protein
MFRTPLKLWLIFFLSLLNFLFLVGIPLIYSISFPLIIYKPEVFSRIGLEIKGRAHKLGKDKVLVIALANGCPGYVPAAEEDYTIAPLGKRGYELEGSYMLDGHPLVASGTSTLMIEAAVGLIEGMTA